MPVYKDEQRGTFFCSFYYTDWTGEKKKKTKRGFKLKREAQAFERSFLEQTQGKPTMTFAALADLYLRDAKSRFRPSTYSKREYIIKARLLPAFENLRIDQITPAHIRKWQNSLIEQDYKDTYLRALHAALSTLFYFAVRYYNLPENPCVKAGTIGRLQAEEMNFWTKAEYTQFITAVEPNTEEHVVFQVLYWSGLRIGELLALTIEDYNATEKTLTVSKSCQRIKREDIITEPKTKKSNRVVLLPNYVCAELDSYISRLYQPQPSTRLFVHRREYYLRRLKKYAERAGVKEIRLHDFRHSHASLLIELGFSPLLIAERLGHEKVEVTLNTYSHLYPNKQTEMVENLEKLE